MFWDAATRQPLGQVLAGHGDNIYAQIRFSPDGKVLAAAGNEGPIKLWNVSTRRLDAVLPRHTCVSRESHCYTNALAMSPDGNLLAAGCSDGDLRLWNIAKRRQVGRVMQGSGKIESISFSADGKFLAAGVDNIGIRLFDVASQRLLGETVTEAKPSASSSFIVSFAPRKSMIAVGSWESVRLWDIGGLSLGQLRKAVDSSTNEYVSLDGDVTFR